MSLGFAGRNKTVTLTSKPQVIADYNLHRHGLFIYNDADAPCKIAFGSTPEAGDYFTLGAGNKIELDSIVPTGPVWATGTGPLHLMDNAMGGSTVGWTPKDLLPEFTNGKSLWYDLSDAATVFEDTAAAVPATVGGPIGMILDKSGNGMNLTHVEGAKPIWDGTGAVFTADSKFVLPGFLNATWVYDQADGVTYYSSSLVPVKPLDDRNRPTAFFFGYDVHNYGGNTLCYTEEQYMNSAKPHWRAMVNNSVTWNTKNDPGMVYGAPVIIANTARFTGKKVGTQTLFRNKTLLDSEAFSAPNEHSKSMTSFFSSYVARDGFRGTFHGLFLQHVPTLEDTDFEKLQRWQATKVGIEV